MKYLCYQNQHLVQDLSVVEEVRDVIVVFHMEKLLNIYFEKNPHRSFAIKKRHCAQEWIGNMDLPRAGENLPYPVLVGEKLLSVGYLVC